jgi:cobalt/nickel transport system permease protein
VSRRALFLVGLVVALVLAGGVSQFASSDPDGLTKVAADHGLDAKEREHDLADGPLSDYSAKGVDDDRLSGAVAGTAGVALTLVLAGGLFLLIRRKPESERQDEQETVDA